MLALLSCSTQKAQSQARVTEGVEGYIYRLSGNPMPMKGKSSGGKGKGVVREVWIYRATNTQQTQGNMPLFTRVNSRLAAKVKSDSTGHYQAKLPAGTYSVFVKESNGLFAAETDGQGILNPVKVERGTVAKRDVRITLDAAF
ncbi:hypothetical protein [Mucilaginibacter sp. PAMB04168]|uniref:hypothetical protein n=1 Tax=Mucilaginibacter sp. PAMB04168 TaxID=3138567 RepID=UPI0031F6058D